MTRIITPSALRTKTKPLTSALKRISKRTSSASFTTHKARQTKKDLIKIHSIFQDLLNLLMQAQYGRNYEIKEKDQSK